MLKANGCTEGFWMGNLKHKNLQGDEVPSQMVGQKLQPKGKRGRKEVESEVEEEEEEEGEEEGAEVQEVDEEEDVDGEM